MDKPLRLWNGRWIFNNDHGRGAHVYIAAHSRADAGRLIVQAAGYQPTGVDREIAVYYSECWGNTMKDITPERGLWVENEDRKLIRLI